MATIVPYKTTTNGTSHGSSSALDRKPSLSSFPASRTPSNNSVQNSIARAAVEGRTRRNGSNSSSQSLQSPSSHAAPVDGFASRPIRKLRSQYPADSPERHVEYILVASFDIDKGPIMEHQYPGAISGDENMLAELMLPDQAHVRNQDWTIFFLHKDTGDEEAARKPEKENKQLETDSENTHVQSQNSFGNQDEELAQDFRRDEEDDEEGGEGPPLIYVLNLVNMKQDNTAKRCHCRLLTLQENSLLILSG
jgi:hypothetical protein